MKRGRKIPGNAAIWIGGLIVIGFIAVGIFAPHIAPWDPLKVNLDMKLTGPSANYLFGTDQMGRDILSRLMYGTRTSLFYSVAVLGAMLVVSVPVGIVAGYVGGKVDQIIMRFIDILLAFPSLILSLAITGMLGPGLLNLLLAFASVWWTSYARIIRGMVLQIKEKDYITAARAGGATHLQIVLRHVLPHAVSPIIVLASVEIGTIILSVSGLSFLGLGAQPPTPEWGVMLSDSRPYMQTEPQLMLFPGLTVMIAVLGFNLVGEGLRRMLRGAG
ncbi:nickel transporter permease [Paenibacillus elgii]|uniref:nickel transporter permease n=1 Tax=Paenibacillus elgii TaxID=189691 RepID=UPI000248C989|nr:nickel transporter permease [Paenibacillus elgii]